MENELTLSADIALSLSEIPKTQKQHKSALILRTILKFSHTKQMKFFTRYLNLEFSFLSALQQRRKARGWTQYGAQVANVGIFERPA